MSYKLKLCLSNTKFQLKTIIFPRGYGNDNLTLHNVRLSQELMCRPVEDICTVDKIYVNFYTIYLFISNAVTM